MSRRKKQLIALWFLLSARLTLPLQAFLDFSDEDVDASLTTPRRNAWSSLPHGIPFSELVTDWLLAFLLIPAFMNIVRRFRRNRRFWAAPRVGLWEAQFLGGDRIVGNIYADWEDDRYKEHFRLSKDAFYRLHRRYGHLLQRQSTIMRDPVPSDKRLAITLHFLAHGLSFSQLALLYGVGKSTAISIVHATVTVFMEHLVKDSIRFPEGDELGQVLTDFENLSRLPQCAGAVDGTFMHIRKPLKHGDSYWCYKQHTATLILAVVDARGVSRISMRAILGLLETKQHTTLRDFCRRFKAGVGLGNIHGSSMEQQSCPTLLGTQLLLCHKACLNAMTATCNHTRLHLITTSFVHDALLNKHLAA